MSEPKHFKHSFTLLEQLYPMNFSFRFFYHAFDFQSISKAKFDYITRHHDMHRWRSLRLSENNQTPGQIQLFCQLYPPHRYLLQLKSLSAVHMTVKYAEEFVSQLVSFDHLVRLD